MKKILGVFLFTVVMTSAAHAQATRTWVSGVGDDVNPCSRTAPCKTFAGAISKTAARGAINVLDPGGFGAISITKGMTIDGTGTLASILSPGTTGVIVNAQVTDDIVLRDLDINGGSTGTNGINIIQAKSVTIENCRISNVNGPGVRISNTSNFIPVTIRNSQIVNNVGTGVLAVPTATGTTQVTISNTVISTNGGNGVDIAGNSNVGVITGCTITKNQAGVQVQQVNSTAFVESSTINNNVTGVNMQNSSTIRLSRCLIAGNTTGINTATGTAVGFSNNTIVGNGSGNSVSSSVLQQ